MRDVDDEPQAEREADLDHDDEGGAPPPQEERPLGEVHALDEWDDDAEDLLR